MRIMNAYGVRVVLPVLRGREPPGIPINGNRALLHEGLWVLVKTYPNWYVRFRIARVMEDGSYLLDFRGHQGVHKIDDLLSIIDDQYEFWAFQFEPREDK